MNNKDFESIRIRIMQEAYELADRNDSEGYNAVKVMCGDVQKMLPPQRTWVGLTNGEMIELSEMKLGSWDLILEVEDKLKDKNMKSEQIKHSLSVGIKSIQSRVFDSENEVISFVKIPIKDSGLVRCEWIELTDQEINLLAKAYSTMEGELNAPAFARAIIRKAQIEVGCAECGVNGNHALYCVKCAEKYLKEKTHD